MVKNVINELFTYIEVEAIAHVASPVVFNAEDPIRDVIELAVKCTLSLLNSAQTYEKNVKSIVVTASIASILNSQVEAGHVYTESDWNDGAYQAALKHKENGEAIDGMLAYVASKNEVERAVWRFRKEKSLLSLFPPFYLDTSTALLFLFPETLEDLKAASSANGVRQRGHQLL
jgi:hypothetical protein